MYKICLMLDEWDNDRNFAGSELELIRDSFDVTVICNSAREDLMQGVRYAVYERLSGVRALLSLVRFVFDKDAWIETGRVLKEKGRKMTKLSEAIRFYINADMFRSFMKKNGFLEDGAVYYSYWYFWKCYAVTHEKDRHPGIRVITRTHEYDLYDYTSPSGYQPFKESMDEKLDAVVFIAEHGRDYYLKKYGRTPGGKYKLYYLGTPSPGPAGDYRKKDVLTVVSCSSIIARKRVFRIVEALSLIDDVNIRWLHFGAGEDEEAVKRLASEKLAPKGNITYEFMGYVKNEDLHAFYRDEQVDAFISASSSEGNPVSVMEALSYGIPVIAPAICNFPNMIKDCGILIGESCGAEELAAAVWKIASMSEGELKKLRDNARSCWEEKYDAGKNNERFVHEVLDRL